MDKEVDQSGRQFTGYLRFSQDDEEYKRAFRYLHKLPGSVNYLKSPFPGDKQAVCQVSSYRFGLLKPKFEEEGIWYEFFEWPEDVQRPFLFPPGMRGRVW